MKKKEDFLSEQDEDEIVSYLYHSGSYLMMGIEREGLEELQQAVKKLEPVEREIVTRKYLSREAEYTRHQEIYKDLGISIVTYKKYRLRALTKLAKELGIGSLAKEIES